MTIPPPSESGPPQRRPPTVIELESGGGLKRLFGGGRGEGRVSLSGAEIVIDGAVQLRAPLRVPPGMISLATVDPGPAEAPRGDATGRFPVLRRLGPNRVLPRAEGIEGWLWTSTGGSAFTVIGDEDIAPNLALIFSTPLEGHVLDESLAPKFLEELRKRSPLGQPAIFGVLVRLAQVEPARAALNRLGVLKDLTDREIAPAQRKHLPTDKPANPRAGSRGGAGASSSVPPPGAGSR